MNAYDWIKPLVRALMCFFGILGNNWLAIRSMPKSRLQLRTNDVLFVNLAVSNLITNYLVDLPDTLDFVIHWTSSGRYCPVFNFCSDVSETSSIFTTMFITIYWHQKLVGSLKHGGAPVQMDNLRLITALLTGSWAFSTIFSIPHFFLVPTDTLNQSFEDCIEKFPSYEARLAYEMLYLTLANIVPIIGIMFASVQIAVTLVQNERRMKNTTNGFTKGGNGKTEATPEPTSKNATEKVQDQRQEVQRSQGKNNSSSNQVRAAKSVMAVATVFLTCWLMHLVLSITITTYESIVMAEMISYIGAIYTCIIPYMYLHGVKKLNCSFKS